MREEETRQPIALRMSKLMPIAHEFNSEVKVFDPRGKRFQ
jgi:hypothetical protein